MEAKIEGKKVEIDVTDLEVLTIVIDDKKQDLDIKKELQIQEEDIGLLQKQVAENASEYAYYSVALAWYQYRQDEIRDEYDRLYAGKDIKIRGDARYVNAKERLYKSLVELDKEVIEKKKEKNKLNYVCDKLQAFVKAIEKKGDRMAQIYSRLKIEEGKRF